MFYQNSKRDIVYPIVLAVVLVFGIFLGITLKNNNGKTSLLVSPKSDKLSSVLSYIENEYVDTIGMPNLVEMTIPSLLKNLDPHSIYIPASEFQSANEPLEGGFDGIGVQFNMPNDTVVVINTIKGGPSEKVGVLAGDRIVKINGKNVAGIKFPQDSVPRLLKGPTGTKVSISVKRKEVKELIDFTIIRDKIPINSVDVSLMVTKEIGYIKISTFAKTTYHEFIKGYKKLKDQGMRKLILDLRGNNGGYMESATSIANEFLPENSLIVYTQGKNRTRENIYSNAHGIAKDVEVVVLIDEFSASASEILAGAIQDNDRGTILGRRSFGKGLVQEQIFFSDGSALRLTIARYYTPSGRSIQKPYTAGGDEEYFNDISNRFYHGEFQQADSIKFADSLKYKTVGGRTVYGGGGIMPDVFIPLDTSGISSYLTRVSNRNFIYRFAFDFVDKHRTETRNLKDFEAVNNYLKKFDIISDFVAYAAKNGVPANNQQIKHSQKILEMQLKAYIARNLIDDDGFYPYIKEIDQTLLKAIEYFENNRHLSGLSGLYIRPDFKCWLSSQTKTRLRKDAIASCA